MTLFLQPVQSRSSLHLVLGRQADGVPQDLASSLELLLPDLKLGRQQPHLGKRELGMGDQL